MSLLASQLGTPRPGVPDVLVALIEAVKFLALAWMFRSSIRRVLSSICRAIDRAIRIKMSPKDGAELECKPATRRRKR
jgi:hypothetical protein